MSQDMQSMSKFHQQKSVASQIVQQKLFVTEEMEF